MRAPIFVGDEVTAAGYRLAGVRTMIAVGDAVARAFAQALESAELVFITAASAAELKPDLLDEVMRRAEPLVLVVPDAANAMLPPDLSLEVDRALGIVP